MRIPIKKLKTYFPREKDKSGQALLLSLLIMAAITAAGVGFATLIISQIKAVENIDNAISASYAAESGLEKAMHIVKSNRQSGETLADTINEIVLVSKTFSIAGLNVDFDDSTSNEEVSTKFSLLKDESRQIDFFYPDEPFDATTGIAHLYLSWDNNPVPVSDIDYDDGYGTGLEWVEVSWTGWDLNGNSFENVKKVLLASSDLGYDPDLCANASYIQCTYITLDPDTVGLAYYQVRVKALYEDINDVEVKALKSDFTLASIPSRVHIKTIGKFGRTQQALSASMPWKIPASGLFDYVIFSEEQINKAPETDFQTSGIIEIERGIEDDDTRNSCECTADITDCSDWPICNGTPRCTDDLGLTIEYWEPSLECNKNELADIGSDIRSSGWGTCNLYYHTDGCIATQHYSKIEKSIPPTDLPYGKGNYYISLRGLYDSNQNSETMTVVIDDGICDPDTDCQRVEVKDLLTSMSNPAVKEYKTCVSQSKLQIDSSNTIIFEYGNNDENNIVHLDWYQFSTGIPSGVSERCDSDFVPLRIQMENGITRGSTASSCQCTDILCNGKNDCGDINWDPGTFGDLEAPLAECFKYSNESSFPSVGADRWDVDNRSHGWGACLLNTDRWIRYEVPTDVPSAPYYVSVRAGFQSDSDNLVKVEVYDGAAAKSGTLTETLISNDLWGSANTPKNAFVECTFSSHVQLEGGYEIKFLAPNNDVYIDWFEISDSPMYRSCNDSAIQYGVIPK
jgi:hypothetical protein